ncbi:MAG: 2-succinyl-5-enolpyruvyl-6-hydroxy-3-cyclohexene-1-carboxylic-acid synthase [Rhodothermales bacterium]
MPDATARAAELWAFLIVEELVRHGVSHFFAAPGSRSTPLILAAARNPKAVLHMHVDERGTAFQALGYGRMAGRAAAWVTTSGTALANGYPAVVEAALEQVPMILLTADRPPELRDAGANQTIRQTGIFSPHVAWETDLPVPTADINPAFVLTTVSHAVWRSAEGPVHVNAMFREPLHIASAAGQPHPPIPTHLNAWWESGAPYTRQLSGSGSGPVTGVISDAERTLAELIAAARRPLVVLGRMPVRPFTEWSAAWASGNVPVLPDVASQFRHPGPGDADGARPFITHYDALLRDRERWPQLAPDLVIQVGRPPVSKRLKSFLKDAQAVTVVLDDSRGRLDPDHQTRYRIHIRPGDALDLLGQLLPYTKAPADWSQTWVRLDEVAADWMSRSLGHPDTLSEQAVVREAVRRFPPDTPLILASSNTIRHADTFSDGSVPRRWVVCNRGASGIDGTIATAAGAAVASHTRASVILGDLALLHDLNSLALADNLTILVVNNDGGGIFSLLPIAREEDVFEPWFGTPHGRTFRAAADLFDLAWYNPKTMPELIQALEHARTASKGVLIEVTTDRTETARAQSDALAGLQASLRAEIPLP